MIKIRNLSFSYDQVEPVLNQINLDFDLISAAIIGQNGAGKTTFVKLLKGLLKSETGEISINGINSKSKTAAELAKVIGLVFQNPDDQLFKRTVLDEVMFGPLTVNMKKERAEQESVRALQLVGLSNKLKVNPHDLSLSDKKLLCIASIVAMDTNIVILDEPTIAQDEEGKQKIAHIIALLKEQRKLVITITHDMEFVASNFERVIVLNNGEVILDGGTRSVFSERALLEKAGVEAPSITRFGWALGQTVTYLNDHEFVDAYQPLIKKEAKPM